MEVNYLGWNLLNGQLEIGFLCLWGGWGVYIPLQITEFWLKVFSLSQKSKINVLGEKSVCFRQALIAFWNKKRRKNICLLLVDRKKEKEWSTECGNERRIIVDMSVKIFFSNRNSVSAVSVYPLAAPLGTFTFRGRIFTDDFSSWTFHISAFSLEINTGYLTAQAVAGYNGERDTYWINFSAQNLVK